MFTDLADRIARRASFERGKARLERDVAALCRDAPVRASGSGPRIGIATFGSGEWHLAIDLLLAHALSIRGARPSLLVCDVPDLPVCDERTADSRHQSRCDGCLAAKQVLLDAGHVPFVRVGDCIAAGALADAQAAVAALPDSALEAFTHQGWPLGQWLHVSCCHFLRRDARGADAEQLETRRRWLVTAIVSCQAISTWLDRVQPDVVLVQGGAHVRWRIARELATARGIPVLSREMGKGGWDSHLYALNADSMNPDLAGAWAEAREAPLTDAEEREVDDLLSALPALTHPPVASARRVALPTDSARTAVAFTNVTWDLATAGRDVAFSGVGDWLDETVAALEPHPDVRLLVRAHPAEAATGTRERITDRLRSRGALPPHVRLIEPEDDITAVELLRRADLALVYNSTAGLEAAAVGTPVVVCGAPHFRTRDFTIDVASRAQYREMLRRWAGGAPVVAPPMARALSRRYLHLFFMRYTIRMGWTTSPLTPPFELRVRSRADLQPGQNAALDCVCDAILSGHQPVLPRGAASCRA